MIGGRVRGPVDGVGCVAGDRVVVGGTRVCVDGVRGAGGVRDGGVGAARVVDGAVAGRVVLRGRGGVYGTTRTTSAQRMTRLAPVASTTTTR